MSGEKAVFNTYWKTELTNEEKEFLNHTMANYRVEYDVPFEQIETLKEACMNELRVYKERNRVEGLKFDLKCAERFLEEYEENTNIYKSKLTPRESLTDPVEDPTPEEIGQERVDMSTYIERGLGF